MSGVGLTLLPEPLRTSTQHLNKAHLATQLSGPYHATKGAATNAAKAQEQQQQLQADAYLSELLSYSLERLNKEPELLQDERQQLERALQGTAVSQYGAFIKAADCLDTISIELSSVSTHLAHLSQGIPVLATTCESFLSHSSQVLEAYARNKQLSENQAVVLELLELPQLMDTCVRNGMYDEALDLQAYVKRMQLLHPELPLVQTLSSQVREVGQTMLGQLLGRLKTSLQLPECLRVMGYLRRMSVFSEHDLRLQFLQCRNECLDRLLADLDDSDAYELLKHLADAHRLHLFDAVMQYRAIFFDSSGGPAGAAATGPAATAFQEPAVLQAAVHESAMLHSWVQHRLTLLLDSLAQHLPAVTDGANLSSVLDHFTYCGSSLARVGLDFQGLLLPVFQQCSLSLFSQHLAAAIEAFTVRLETHKWVPMHAPLMHKAASAKAPDTASSSNLKASEGGALDRAGAAGAQEASDAAVPADDPTPPYALMEHLPLAVFTNGVLSALNELRQCALQQGAQQAAGLLQQALEAMASALLHYRHTHNLPDGEAGLFRAAANAGLEVVLPYTAKAFARIFLGTGAKVNISAAAATIRQVMQEA